MSNRYWRIFWKAASGGFRRNVLALIICWRHRFVMMPPIRTAHAFAGQGGPRVSITPAASVETALAEMAFYRLLFYAESPATPLPANAAEYTAFSAEIGTSSSIDLTKPRLSDDKAIWTHPTDYDPCQTLAETARAADIEAILYQSVRDPDGGLNIALLTPLAFARKQPVERVSWRIRLAKTGIQALCEFPMRRIGFCGGRILRATRALPHC